MKIEGTLYFENSLDCSAVLSGAELPVIVGGVQGVFALPRLAQRNSSGEHMVSPPSNAHPEVPSVERDWRGIKTGKHEWGKVLSTGDGNLSFSMKAARLWFPIVGPYKDAVTEAVALEKRVLDSLVQWTEIFQECFEVITSQDLSGYNPVKSYDSWVQFLLINDDASAVPIPPRTREVSFLLGGSGGEPASKEQLILALDKASQGVRPNIEHVLLRDSMRGLLWKHYRRSVIDSSSAVEVALTNKAQQLLERDNSTSLARVILQRFQGLSDRFVLCGHLDISLPDLNYRRDIIELRNRVAHRGNIPSHDEAVKAFQAALAIVNAVTDGKFA